MPMPMPMSVPAARRPRLFVLALLTALLTLASCAGPRAPDASQALTALLAHSDEAFLKRNPLWALYRGDLRFAAQHGDYLSDAYVAAECGAARDNLRRLTAIERALLDAVGSVAYDTFAWQETDRLRRCDPALSPVRLALTLEHLDGWHMFFPDLSSGEGVAPYKTVADYEHGLARIDGFIIYLDRALARAREGLPRGVVQPRVVVERLIEQFDVFAKQTLEDSPYYGPIRKLPADLAPADQERLRTVYAAALRERLVPAFVRLRDALRSDVLPRARATVGLSQMPGGAAYYRYLVESHTTTTMTPDAIHDLGLAEVARIRAGMDAVRRRVGFDAGLVQFFDHLRSDPRFKPASAQALGDGYRAIGARVDAALPRLFDVKPRAALEIRPMPDYQAKTDAAARYLDGTADGARPGVFFYNTWDLPSRTTPTMETLYLHEALPGHHMQVMLAAENQALPKLLRHGGNTAYMEGWALYAESLGAELGLFVDPYQLYGHYDYEMLRAMRLVVDTGMHTKGWTREQAIDYMLANSAMSRTDVVAEVERYIAVPAQALAYKVGQLTIARLRAKAERALGERFDIRAFHSQVLMTGALPMQVLEAKIDAWVAAQARR